MRNTFKCSVLIIFLQNLGDKLYVCLQYLRIQEPLIDPYFWSLIFISRCCG